MAAVCTLAAFVACHPKFPLVVAANRDEFFSRPTTGPTWQESPRALWFGMDLRAGGTWLGANEYGLVAAVLNRRAQTPPDPDRRSRGILVAGALCCHTAQEAVTQTLSLPPDSFNLCTLLIADLSEAVLLANETNRWRIRRLDPGLHVVTNRETESLECARYERTVCLLSPVVSLLQGGDLEEALLLTFRALRDHGEGETAASDPLSVPCVHTPEYGTRSSSVIIADAYEERMRLFHATGAPCGTHFEELPPLALRRNR